MTESTTHPLAWTASAPIVTAALIDCLAPHVMIVDIAAPPGSCDLDHAKRTGRKAVWARALCRRAPVTVGRSQWRGIARIIDGILKRGHAPLTRPAQATL